MTRAAFRCCLALAALALVVTLTAPAQAQEGRVGLLIEPDHARQIGYTTHWAQNLRLARGTRVHQAAVVDGMVLLVEPPGNVLTALSVTDGELLWKRRLGNSREPLHAPQRSGDTIIVNSEHRLFGLSADTGERRFVIELDGPVASPVQLYGRMAIVPGAGGVLYAIDAATGMTQWAQRVPGRITARPAMLDDFVFVADMSGRYALYTLGGRLHWQGRGFGRFEADPVMIDETVFVPSRDATLYAIDTATGNDRWRYIADQPLTVGPRHIDGTVLLPLPGRSLVALDAATGAERWRLAAPMRVVTRRDDGRLVVGSPSRLELIDFDNGRSRGSAPAGSPLHNVLEGPDGSLIAVSAGGRVLRLNRLP
ncbi:MAG: PQQ-binding-like beta-propeller repeat protein [Phycisphaeraceae bacterium]